MVDANSLYPDGYHPVRLDHSPDTIHPVTPLSRTGRKLQYYYIDFGLACQDGQLTIKFRPKGQGERS